MRIRWYGHSCFLLTDNSGLRILTDPFDDSIGYAAPIVSADLITISHSHFDHSAVGHLPGTPQLVQSLGSYHAGEVVIRGISAFHDGQSGRRRGPNVMFHIVMEEVRILHCGDLGHLLQPQQQLQTGPIDILMVPVGGALTLDSKEAKGLCEQLKPHIVIPMHYKTPALNFPLAPLDEFIRLFPADRIISKESMVDIQADEMPSEQEVWVMDYR